MYKKILLVVMIAVMLVVGGVARLAVASTTTELEAQIKELLAKVAELTNQLKIQQGRGNDTSDSVSGSDGAVIEPAHGYYRHRICVLPMHTLSEGQSGDDVHALQEFLQSENVLTATPTGFFGPMTREALKKWQVGQGISPAGVAGPKTTERLRTWCNTENLNPADNPQCKSWYDGCNACARSIPGGHGMCTLMACTGMESKPYCIAYFDSSPKPIACTREYNPVCGRPSGCVNTCTSGQICPEWCQLKTPQTYSNRCQSDAAGATFLHTGQCTSTSGSIY